MNTKAVLKGMDYCDEQTKGSPVEETYGTARDPLYIASNGLACTSMKMNPHYNKKIKFSLSSEG